MPQKPKDAEGQKQLLKSIYQRRIKWPALVSKRAISRGERCKFWPSMALVGRQTETQLADQVNQAEQQFEHHVTTGQGQRFERTEKYKRDANIIGDSMMGAVLCRDQDTRGRPRIS